MKLLSLFVLISIISSLCVCHTLLPQPKSISVGTDSVVVDSNFNIDATGPGAQSQILKDRIEEYKSLFFLYPSEEPVEPTDALSSLTVDVQSAEENLILNSDESYTLSVENAKSASLSSNTIWGALRGLETFSQLIVYNYSTTSYSIPELPILINDAPRFPWRGVMLDTARHFYPVKTIKEFIRTMSFSKFNTFHWHAIDAQSFPFEIKKYPLLAEKGAYCPWCIYTQTEIKDVITFAKGYGIRVVIEFDGPGHAAAIGKGYKELVANCPNYEHNINNIPLDPTQQFTYDVVNDMWTEMSELIEDRYIHYGGDEVVQNCWNEDSKIKQWMEDNNMNTGDLNSYYFEKLSTIAKDLNLQMVVWEEVFDLKNHDFLTNAIVQVWRDSATLKGVVEAKIKALLSYGWYLDRQSPDSKSHYEWIDTWQDMYNNEPFDGITSGTEYILGGEAAMWSEQVFPTSLQTRVWPRACAIGERLWSQKDVTDISDAKIRINQHSCRLSQRDIPTSPLYPGFCFTGKP
ncbi:beta-hexosaminidase subunit a1-related [Anaeramoeba flamelloides]|uniref:Beta-hexosaminidase n=1 Tax=Anaeramoeba flamelloides TaxID=1746091 RepID=A0ABQ8XBJ3_9EUKA|nr:beta-hexosaminidase subunit a1-related [Anaeramoeba flamelloides]